MGSRTSLALTAALPLLSILLSACGGGGSSGGGAIRELESKVGVQNAILIDAPAPASSLDPDAPKLTSSEAPVQSIAAPSSVPIDVSLDTSGIIRALIVKIAGSSRHFRLNNPPAPSAASATSGAIPKAVFAQQAVLQIAPDLEAADFCVDIAGVDSSERVSNYERFCFVLPQNDPAASTQPFAHAGGQQVVARGATAILDGSGSQAADGSPLIFSWRQIDGPAVNLVNADSAMAQFLAPQEDGSENLRFRLTVTDNAARTDSNDTEVLLAPAPPANRPPDVNAGGDRSARPGQSVNLTGSAVDIDGSITDVSWRQISGPAITLSGANTQTPSFVATGIGNVVLLFEATDDDGATAGDFVTVAVSETPSGNQPPVVGAGNDRSVASGELVALAGSASDIDGSVVAVSWTQVSGPAVSLFSSDTLTPSFVAAGAGTVVLRLEARDDDGDTASDTVTIVVSGGTVAPPTVNAGVDRSVQQGASVNLVAMSTGNIVSVAWTQVSGPGPVSFTPPNALATSFVAPNVSSNQVVLARVTVTDDRGANASDEVSITVTPDGVVVGTGLSGSYHGLLFDFGIAGAGPAATAAEGSTTTDVVITDVAIAAPEPPGASPRAATVRLAFTSEQFSESDQSRSGGRYEVSALYRGTGSPDGDILDALVAYADGSGADGLAIQFPAGDSFDPQSNTLERGLPVTLPMSEFSEGVLLGATLAQNETYRGMIANPTALLETNTDALGAFFVRKASGFSLSALTGNYNVIIFEQDHEASGYRDTEVIRESWSFAANGQVSRSDLGTFELSREGEGSGFQVMLAEEAAAGPIETLSAIAAADGALSLSGPGPEGPIAGDGFAAADGNFFVMSIVPAIARSNAEGVIKLVIGVRAPPGAANFIAPGSKTLYSLVNRYSATSTETDIAVDAGASLTVGPAGLDYSIQRDNLRSRFRATRAGDDRTVIADPELVAGLSQTVSGIYELKPDGEVLFGALEEADRSGDIVGSDFLLVIPNAAGESGIGIQAFEIFGSGNSSVARRAGLGLSLITPRSPFDGATFPR